MSVRIRMLGSSGHWGVRELGAWGSAASSPPRRRGGGRGARPGRRAWGVSSSARGGGSRGLWGRHVRRQRSGRLPGQAPSGGRRGADCRRREAEEQAEEEEMLTAL